MSERLMKNKCYIIVLGLMSVLVIAAYVIFMQAKENRYLRVNMPYLLPNEKITYFDIIGVDNERVDASTLSGKLSVIFIFKTPCSKCNENILFWSKIAKILDGKANVFGIVSTGYGEMADFSEKARLNFKLYTPDEPDKFKKHLKIRINIAQTILYYDKSVVMVKIGDLDADDYMGILKKAKVLIRRKDS
jgi:peroxiredoxin